MYHEKIGFHVYVVFIFQYSSSTGRKCLSLCLSFVYYTINFLNTCTALRSHPCTLNNLVIRLPNTILIFCALVLL
jgi:hypothetical protein